eukprot:224987-Amorphochlora_amoeboformis.AAC.1
MVYLGRDILSHSKHRRWSFATPLYTTASISTPFYYTGCGPPMPMFNSHRIHPMPMFNSTHIRDTGCAPPMAMFNSPHIRILPRTGLT